VILNFGTLHRVVNPLDMLMILRHRLADNPTVLLWSHGIEAMLPSGRVSPPLRVDS
jgi:hypothetical protein